MEVSTRVVQQPRQVQHSLDLMGGRRRLAGKQTDNLENAAHYESAAGERSELAFSFARAVCSNASLDTPGAELKLSQLASGAKAVPIRLSRLHRKILDVGRRQRVVPRTGYDQLVVPKVRQNTFFDCRGPIRHYIRWLAVQVDAHADAQVSDAGSLKLVEDLHLQVVELVDHSDYFRAIERNDVTFSGAVRLRALVPS